MDPPTNSNEDTKGIQLGPIDPESGLQPDIHDEHDDDYDDEYGSLVHPSRQQRPRPPPPRNLPSTRRRPPLFWTPRLPGRRGRAPSPPPSSSSSPLPSPFASPAAPPSSPSRAGGQPQLLPLASYLKEWLKSTFSTDDNTTSSSPSSFSRYKVSLALLLVCTLSYIALDSYDIIHVSFNDDGEVPKWKKLNTSLQRAKRRLDVLLESEYGELAEVLFGNETMSRAFQSDSVHRLKNRMKMKIIQAGLMRKIVAKGEPGSGFVWVTGGDDYAAGYGNFYNQTYTWMIEDTVKDAFNMVGIKFHAKNYAMGGTPSGPEISLCMETTFGNDIDILSWDYAKSDGDNYDLYRLWGNRAGIHPTIPTLFRLGKDPTRSSIDDDFQRFGLSAIQFDVDYIRSLVPDTSWETVDDLPPEVRYYKCAGQVEGGSVLCKENKWNTEGTTCDLSEYQTKEENRGWKDHKLIGRVIGVFLVDTLLSALAELEESLLEVSTIRNISVSQDKDRYAFQSSSLREMHVGANLGKNTKFLGGHAKYSPFWRSSSFCHSALLPNHARFTGAVTLSMRSYRHDHGYFVGYDEGYAVDALPETKPKDGQFLLAYLPETRQNCSDVYRADYKDFFLVRKQDGWVKVALPNQLEMKQFRIKGDNRGAHVIALCAEGLSVAAIKLKKIEMKVDGADVLDVRTLNDELSQCRLLVGEHDSFLWIAKPGGTGQFELEIKLNEPEELRITTIIII